jgi:hypothetical protein
MKNLILFLLLIPIFGSSQARIGSLRIDIYKEFAEYSPKFENPSDDISSLHFETDRALVVHYFDNSEYCTMSVIAPKTQGDLNLYVEAYNRMYVVINPKEWRMYSENGSVSTIELVTNKGTTFFVWQ